MAHSDQYVVQEIKHHYHTLSEDTLFFACCSQDFFSLAMMMPDLNVLVLAVMACLPCISSQEE
jgi:hypothetical protein